MLRGGGVAFGPKPRDFSSELPKKVYDLAWRTALSYRFRKGELIIVDNAMEIESPSTRLLGDIFKHQEKLRGKGRSLMVTLEERPLLEEALAEMDRGEQTLTWEEVDVKDLLGLSRIMIERDALHNILLTHEEDLTHTTLQPWHKSLIRSSPPSALESTIGWEEFRALSLWKPPKKDEDKEKDEEEDDGTPKTKNAARIAAYESAASTRFAYAESLPSGPKHTELTASVYNLIVEAKELQFLEKTGLRFSEYSKDQNPEKFPRLQVLGYQQSIKEDLKTEAAETERQKAEEIQVQIQELAVKGYEVQADAALLAAQIHEHRAEALRMSGQEEKAEEELEMASGERTNVEDAEIRVLEAKVELAKQRRVVAGLKRDFVGQQKAAQEQRVAQEALNQMQAEAEAENVELEGFEEEVDEVGVATSVEEPARDTKEEKRI
jgi:large subunit ribosomal protein L4